MTDNPAAIALLCQHNVLRLHFRDPFSRWRCARYLLRIQAQRQAELSREEMIELVELFRCSGYGVIPEELLV